MTLQRQGQMVVLKSSIKSLRSSFLVFSDFFRVGYRSTRTKILGGRVDRLVIEKKRSLKLDSPK